MKTLFFTFVALTIAFGFAQVQAISIQNNGSGSQNSIIINDGSSTNIQQGSSLQIQNNVNANANTGGNTASGNSVGNTNIKTGDATSIVGITNNGNTNTVVSTPCCTTPSNLKPTSTPKPGNTTPTPTQNSNNPDDPGNTNDNNESSKSNNNGSSSPQTQGEILGLANTASNDLPTQAFTALGVLCLAIGSALLSKNIFLK